MSLTHFDVQEHVATITLNRPKAMNALNPELRFELSERFNEVEAREDIWLAIVTGAGERAFCAGADLKHFALEREASDEQRAAWADMAAQTRPLNHR